MRQPPVPGATRLQCAPAKHRAPNTHSSKIMAVKQHENGASADVESVVWVPSWAGTDWLVGSRDLNSVYITAILADIGKLERV